MVKKDFLRFFSIVWNTIDFSIRGTSLTRSPDLLIPSSSGLFCWHKGTALLGHNANKNYYKNLIINKLI
jgi:hypothetical protein